MNKRWQYNHVIFTIFLIFFKRASISILAKNILIQALSTTQVYLKMFKAFISLFSNSQTFKDFKEPWEL